MALLGDDSRQVVCAACCHMALVFAIMHLYMFFFCVCVLFFLLFLSFFFSSFKKQLVSVKETERLTISAC